MALLNRFKKKEEEAKKPVASVSKKAEKSDKKVAKKDAKKADVVAEVIPVTPMVAGEKVVLVRPIITEKATLTGTYIFEIARDSNKSEVKKAVKKKYGATPVKVRVMNVTGKSVRWKGEIGTQKSWKKAIVRLKKGETINVYEGL